MSLQPEIEKELLELYSPSSLWEILEGGLNQLQSQLGSSKKTSVHNKFIKKIISERPAYENLKRLEISGYRMAIRSGLNHAKKLVLELTASPEDTKARLELVGMMLRNTDGKDVLVNRDAFLLSMLEADQDLLNGECLRIALQSQHRYLASFEQILKMVLSETNLSAQGSNPSLLGNPHSSVKNIEKQKLKQGVVYLGGLQKQLRIKGNERFDAVSLKSLLTEGNSRIVMKVLKPYLDIVSALPLARSVRKQILEILKRFAENNPTASYAECLLFRKRAMHLLSSLFAGNEDHIDAIGRLLNLAYRSSVNSVRMLSKAPHEDQKLIIREYALVCQLLFHSLSKLNKSFNAEHFKHYEHASNLLPKIINERGVPAMLKNMRKTICIIRGETV